MRIILENQDKIEIFEFVRKEYIGDIKVEELPGAEIRIRRVSRTQYTECTVQYGTVQMQGPSPVASVSPLAAHSWARTDAARSIRPQMPEYRTQNLTFRSFPRYKWLVNTKIRIESIRLFVSYKCGQ